MYSNVNNLKKKKPYLWLICQIKVITTIKSSKKKEKKVDNQTLCLGKIPTQATLMDRMKEYF
jgi:hypothetical protein